MVLMRKEGEVERGGGRGRGRGRRGRGRREGGSWGRGILI